MEHFPRAEALIWIFFVGGVAAKGMAERVWFVKKLSGLMEWQGVMNWTEVKQLLRGFIWVTDAMDDEAINLWDEVCYHDYQMDVVTSVEV